MLLCAWQSSFECFFFLSRLGPEALQVCLSTLSIVSVRELGAWTVTRFGQTDYPTPRHDFGGTSLCIFAAAQSLIREPSYQWDKSTGLRWVLRLSMSGRIWWRNGDGLKGRKGTLRPDAYPRKGGHCSSRCGLTATVRPHSSPGSMIQRPSRNNSTPGGTAFNHSGAVQQGNFIKPQSVVPWIVCDFLGWTGSTAIFFCFFGLDGLTCHK